VVLAASPVLLSRAADHDWRPAEEFGEGSGQEETLAKRWARLWNPIQEGFSPKLSALAAFVHDHLSIARNTCG
jgi:hypothetical protein